MTADQMRGLVKAARAGRLATLTSAGRPHLVPICYVLEAETVYSAVDMKPKSTGALKRLANIRANPVATLLVDRYEEDWDRLWWVRMDGRARILEAGMRYERALELLAEKYEQYRRQPPRAEVLELEVESWRGWSATPMPVVGA